MPVIINKLPKRENKLIVMGKASSTVADYYPPGAMEPTRPVAISSRAPMTTAAAVPIPAIVEPATAVLTQEVSDSPRVVELVKNQRGRPKKVPAQPQESDQNKEE